MSLSKRTTSKKMSMSNALSALKRIEKELLVIRTNANIVVYTPLYYASQEIMITINRLEDTLAASKK